MTKTRSSILACLQANLDNAKTEIMREHVRQQIASFKKHLTPKLTPRTQPNWDRIIPNESPT